MTGAELAVLHALLPVLIQGVKAFKSYLKSLDTWYNFRSSFTKIVRNIQSQSVNYKQNLEFLVALLDIHEADARILEDNPSSDLWHEPEVQAELRRLLKPDYFPWFMDQLSRMAEIVRELYGMLPIKDGKAQYPPPGTVDEHILKLATSFSKTIQPLIDEMTSINLDLHNFLNNARRIEKVRKGKAADATERQNRPRLVNRKIVKPFLQLQQCASQLFLALCASWDCKCYSPHECAIAIDWGNQGFEYSGAVLRLLVGSREPRTHLKVELRSQGDNTAIAPNEKEKDTGLGTRLDQIHGLSRQTENETKSKKRQEAGEEHKPTVLAIHTVAQITEGPATVDSNKLMQPRQLNRLRRRARETDSRTSTDSERVEGEKTGETEHGSVVEGRATGNGRWPGLSNVFKRLASKKAEPPKQTKAKRVHFPESGSPRVASPSMNLKTPSQAAVCTLLDGAWEAGGVKNLAVGHDQVSLKVDPPNKGQVKSSEIQGLESFWQSARFLPERLRIGLVLARSFLGIGSSLWVQDCWHQDVTIAKLGLSEDHGKATVFINHKSISLLIEEKIESPRRHAEHVLFSLGVLLLQLIFKQKLEDQNCYKKHCVDDKPNASTEYCVAIEWQGQVKGKYGMELADVIEYCVKGQTILEPNLGKEDFIQEVLSSVVSPLETFLRTFEGRYI
ncbi:hypothetical protein GQ53DRAFT_840838 [Thozetella sp. PMI_491]|nr:hypothetical protein GQ53DRAFT_840838 [Thozetella sp. PMI_491]